MPKQKTCTKCGETKSLDDFHRDSKNRDGRKYDCKFCVSVYSASPKARAAQRRYKATPKGKATVTAGWKKYRHQPRGFLISSYGKMRYRVKIGGTCARERPGNSWEGKEILAREEFLEWALNDSQFQRLFKFWAEAGYPMKLTPSIERIDSQKGYTLDNMEWLTQSSNSALANIPGKVAKSAALRKALALC